MLITPGNFAGNTGGVCFEVVEEGVVAGLGVERVADDEQLDIVGFLRR